jgi:rhamnose transport system substrate-binding protein
MLSLKRLALATALATGLIAGPASAENVKIALVVKALGIGFFEAANKGAQEAAKELGDVEIIYTGPTDTTAEGQIEGFRRGAGRPPDASEPVLQRAHR